MSTTIAITGKGGVGKSTLTALIIRWLKENGAKSILAVDADSNVNLNDLLGVEVDDSIGEIREEMKESIDNLPGGMTKQQFMEYKIHQCLSENDGFDLITMGRPEGPGCYCYSNNILRDILKELSDNYEFVVIDNEAGMEHLSRRTVQNIDYLLIISDPSVRGVQTAGRISRLLKELDTRIGRKNLILNRVNNTLSQQINSQIEKENLDLISTINTSDEVGDFDATGRPVYEISTYSSIYGEVDRFMSELLPDLKNKRHFNFMKHKS